MENRPRPTDATEWLYTAFFALSPSRQIGMAGGPIPVSEIKAYCDLLGIDDPDDREELLAVIREMDAVYLEIRADERKRDQERKAALKKQGGR